MQTTTSFFGTVQSGSTNRGFTVEFDAFPAGEKLLTVIRKRLGVLEKNAEETNMETPAIDRFFTTPET
jgi:hypothetical protein